jgi:membrane-bound lytic murein transglycosylase B
VGKFSGILLVAALLAAVTASGLIASPTQAQTQKFSDWVEGVRKDATARGVDKKIFDTAFKGVKPVPRIIELDRKQPEFTLTFNQYLSRVGSEVRVKKGRAKLAENKEILEKVGKKYGVQPRFIVALWGIETDFGRISGGFNVITALATLAYDGRRSKYFRGELLNALEILDQGHIKHKDMTGSWAGAMGQCQFMPSSFKAYAIDADGDGRRDLWGTKADVFASAANYLSSVGWNDDQTWGRKVKLPENFDLTLASKGSRAKDSKPLSLAEWQTLGVRKADGGDLPKRNLKASLVLPAKGKSSPAYLVYGNYRSILHWNRSTYFALTVGYLADRIGRVK